MTTQPANVDGRRRFAIVTGASSGIGLELAQCCSQDGWDLLLVADEPIPPAVASSGPPGTVVHTLIVDLSTSAGVDAVISAVGERMVDALFANAGLALGGAFVDQPFERLRRVVDTNIVGTLDLVHRVGRGMRARGAGKILITGSIVGSIPGAYQAVYNSTKAFLNSFAVALRHELNDTGVTVTLLMPGPTDTAAFARAGLQESLIGRAPKDDPAGVARAAYTALLNGDSEVVPGIHNKLIYAAAQILPAGVTAALHAVAAKVPR